MTIRGPSIKSVKKYLDSWELAYDYRTKDNKALIIAEVRPGYIDMFWFINDERINPMDFVSKEIQQEMLTLSWNLIDSVSDVHKIGSIFEHYLDILKDNRSIVPVKIYGEIVNG